MFEPNTNVSFDDSELNAKFVKTLKEMISANNLFAMTKKSTYLAPTAQASSAVQWSQHFSCIYTRSSRSYMWKMKNSLSPTILRACMSFAHVWRALFHSRTGLVKSSREWKWHRWNNVYSTNVSSSMGAWSFTSSSNPTFFYVSWFAAPLLALRHLQLRERRFSHLPKFFCIMEGGETIYVKLHVTLNTTLRHSHVFIPAPNISQVAA